MSFLVDENTLRKNAFKKMSTQLPFKSVKVRTGKRLKVDKGNTNQPIRSKISKGVKSPTLPKTDLPLARSKFRMRNTHWGKSVVKHR